MMLEANVHAILQQQIWPFPHACYRSEFTSYRITASAKFDIKKQHRLLYTSTLRYMHMHMYVYFKN